MNDSRVSVPVQAGPDCRCGTTGPKVVSSWIQSFGTQRASRRPSVLRTRWAPRCVNSSQCGRIVMNDSRVSVPVQAGPDCRCGTTGPKVVSSWIQSFGTQRASRRPSVLQTRWAPRCVNSSQCGRIVMNDSRVSVPVQAGPDCRCGTTGPKVVSSWIQSFGTQRASRRPSVLRTRWAPRCVNSSQCGRIIMNDSRVSVPVQAGPDCRCGTTGPKVVSSWIQSFGTRRASRRPSVLRTRWAPRCVNSSQCGRIIMNDSRVSVPVQAGPDCRCGTTGPKVVSSWIQSFGTQRASRRPSVLRTRWAPRCVNSSQCGRIVMNDSRVSVPVQAGPDCRCGTTGPKVVSSWIQSFGTQRASRRPSVLQTRWAPRCVNSSQCGRIVMNDSRVSVPVQAGPDCRCGTTGPKVVSSWIQSFGTQRASRRPSVLRTRWAPRCVNSSQCGRIIMNDSRVSVPVQAGPDCRCGTTGPKVVSSWIQSFGTQRASRRPSVLQTRWAPRCVNSSQCGRIIMNDSPTVCPEKARRERRWTSDLVRSPAELAGGRSKHSRTTHGTGRSTVSGSRHGAAVRASGSTRIDNDGRCQFRRRSCARHASRHPCPGRRSGAPMETTPRKRSGSR